MLKSRSARWPVLLAQFALAGLVCGVFFPILGYEFVNLDVLTQIEDYPPIRSLSWENIRTIFTSRHVTSYYPVRTLSYAVDYQIWGFNPGGFKLTNGLIHLANVLLLFRLILHILERPNDSGVSTVRGWNAAAAAFGAGIFAVHPLVVEPVTWVSGREELLMTLGVLGAIHFHLAARSREARGARQVGTLACHAGTVLCCAAACLSNAIAAVLPLLVTAWDLLTLPRPRGRRILHATLPLWALAVAVVVIKKLGKSHHADAIVAAFSPEWPMTICKLYGANLTAVFWPHDLALSYGWTGPTSFLDPHVVLGALAIVLTIAALWLVRKHPFVLFGLLWFGIALGPTSQVMPHYVAQADRFLYLPLVGLAIVAAQGAESLVRILRRRETRAAVLVAAASSLLVLAFLAGAQVRLWRTNITVWENCLRVCPTNHLAHRFLADELAKKGELDRAIAHYKTAISLDLQNDMALNNLARVLITCTPERRDYSLALELAEYAAKINKRGDPRIPRTLAMVHNGLGLEATTQEKHAQAIESYRRAIAADPEYAMPQFNLALLLATCTDETLRRPEESIRLARQACRIVGTPDANQWMILATACAQAGQWDEAIRSMEQAIQAAELAGDRQHADVVRRQLQFYRTQLSPQQPRN